MTPPPTPSSGNRRRRPNSRTATADQFNQSIIQNSTVHTNVGQQVIVTTEDKIDLALIRHQKYSKAKSDWLTPFSTLLTVIASLAAADFKDFFSIPADSWRAIFILLAVLSGLWLVICIYRLIAHRNKGTNEDFIKTLKSGANQASNP